VAAVILKVTMGERMVGPAVVSGLSGFGLGVALFAINFPAELTFSVTPLPLVAGVLGAVVAGIALPWNRARVAGWVALIAAIAMVVTPLTIRWQDERRVAALDADDAAQAQFDYEIETAILPTVTEAEGMTLSDLQANDQARYAHVPSDWCRRARQRIVRDGHPWALAAHRRRRHHRAGRWNASDTLSA